MTLSNVTLYNSVVPSYVPDKEKDKKGKRLSGDSKKDVEEFNRLLRL